MKIISLARYFVAKYATEDNMEPDISFGAPINAAKTKILKDKLKGVYAKLASGVASLPSFKKINEEFKDNPVLTELNFLLLDYVAYVDSNNLKDCFGYSVKLIHKLNDLRNQVKGMPREKMFELETSIKSIQDYVWQEGKRILNIHDLRGILLNFPKDVREKVNELVPTWDFGPGKNPAYKKMKIRQYETSSDLMKRLLRENEEEAAKKKGK